MYLLDTNTIIYFFKDIGNIKEALLSNSPQEIYVPSIVIYELEVGIAKSSDSTKRKRQLKKLLSQINIIDFSHKEARTSAAIRAKLEKLGTPIGPIDTLIAGCALANNLTLVTRNVKEFKRVDGLNVQNWYI